MSQLVIQGAQWGDEGKGKITDYFAQQADMVVRSQGGNNAGHSIVYNGKRFALRLVPSGIFSSKTTNIIANGVVVNIKGLKEELEGLNQQGITDYKLFISDRAQILMPYHIDLDGAFELLLGDNKIGTTKKGIGPCYADKTNRIGFRMGDLLEEEYLVDHIKSTLPIINNQLKSYNLKEYTFDEIYSYLKEYGDCFKPLITNTSNLINKFIKENKKVLFEGAQGAMLCLDHGTYPYVTSSSPLANGVSVNSGVAPYLINNILGVAKAYTTRVGEGPFPSELFDQNANLMREKGHEYGTVTKRPRRIGWLDLVVLNHVKNITGMQHLALMLADVLSSVDQLKICVSYTLDGKVIDYVPANLETYKRCVPNYITLPSFKDDISNCKSFDELPIQLKEYIKTIEKYTNLHVSIVSVGPDRSQTIIRENIF